MTNEQYLYVSYFVAAAIGVAGAVATTLILAGPHRDAMGGAVPRLSRILRRAFPAWLVLAVLLGFMSVTYIDCSHENYAAVVADREHLVEKTQEQAATMARYLAVALIVYGFVLVFFLWARARTLRSEPQG